MTEYKHIKIIVNGLDVKITEQTHRGVNFGYDSDKCFICSNGMRLLSVYRPEAENTQVFLRGDATEYDNDVIYFRNDEHLNKFIIAVDEYNKAFCGFSIANSNEIERILEI